MKHMMKSLWKNERGSALMFAGLGLMVLVGSTGMAIDMSRIQTVNAKLSSALDAAGLAAGAKAHSSDINAVVNNYMNVNFPTNFMDSTITNITVTSNPDKTLINLSATAEVNMTFMNIFGINTWNVTTTSEITRENRGLELAMVLDVTGSMYGGGKIGDLRTAATDMVNILFGDEETHENLWVGIVPYTTTVNIGNSNTAWLRNFNPNLYPPNYPAGATQWKGCVEARNQHPESNGYDVDDTVPDAADPETLFPVYHWASEWDNEWINPGTGAITLNEGAGYGNTSARGPNVGCGNQVTPLTSSKSTLLSAVSALTPWRRGGTMSSIGAAWGWRMISPNWRGMLSTNATIPLDYGTPLMNKAVILMTDGINQVYTPHSNPPFGSDYTGYRRIGEERLGEDVDTAGEGVTEVNNRFSAICTGMKSQGILVYTVTFRLGNSTAHNNARTLFRNCATHPDFYFDSPDGATLRASFKQIGDSLANLMISR